MKSPSAPPGLRVLQGSYYEIGVQLGGTMRGLQVPEAHDRLLAFAKSCEDIVAGIHPPSLEKVEGMIEGSGFSRRDFIAFFYARDASPGMGCTSIAVLPERTADGSLLVGVNYDWYYYSQEWRELRRVRPDGACQSLRVTHHWAGSPDGINDAGLGVFLSVLPCEEAVGPGLGWHLVTGILLDTCRTLEEACELVASAPHLGAFNYLITDAGGRAVVAEASPSGVTIREPEDGFITATNHLPGREVPEEDLSPDDRRRLRRSLQRYAHGQEVIQSLEGLIDESTIKSLLCDHDAPVCRGQHDPVEGDTSFDNVFGTIWSLIARPAERSLQVAWGHPCRSDYVSHSLN